MTVIERFLKYVTFDTQSDESTGVTPSTPKQMVFAQYLKTELEELGLKDISLDENGYLFATLPSNVNHEVPVVGFIAHMDTSPDMSGENVKPRIVEKYDGKDIPLCAEENIILSPANFPELLDHVGEDLIVTDGHTLLGADDKAGIAEIVGAVAYLIAHPEIKHGDIRIGFNPDEEIGLGAHKFDVEKFGAKWAYTMDGGEVGELEFENFNAAAAKIRVKGRNVHPGYAKNKMINSLLVANEYASLLPANETPGTTEGYEGFYHLNAMSGNVTTTNMKYLIRDFDKENFDKRAEKMQEIAEVLNQKYGEGSVEVKVTESYRNMREKIEPCMELVDMALAAIKNVGLEPVVEPIRGGTDGARLSFMGLPCPNLGTGGHAFHGVFEHITVEGMDLGVKIVKDIVRQIAE